MESTPNGVYKKSIKSLDALKMRTDQRDASARAALIRINGSDSLAALQHKLGRDIALLLKTLLALRLIERVAVAASAAPLQKPPRQTRKLAFFLTKLIANKYRPACARSTFYTKKSSTAPNAYAPAQETKLCLYQERKSAANLIDGLRP